MAATGEVASWLQLAAVVACGLALLYLLRPQRRRVEVPFGGLWQKVLLQSQARAFGRKWQRLWSFLVLLLIAGGLLGALGEPIFRPEPPPQAQVRWSTVLMVDVSASMATLDGQTPATSVARPQTRLAEAKWRAGQWLDSLPADEQVLLLTASGHATVLAGWGSDRGALQRALASIETTDAGLDLRRAVEDAQAMLAGRPGPRVVLASDLGPPLEPLSSRVGGVGSESMGAATPGIEGQKSSGTPPQPQMQDPQSNHQDLHNSNALGPLEVLPVGPPRQLTATGAAAALELAALSAQPVDDLAIADVRLRPELGDVDIGTLTVRIINRSSSLQVAKLAVRSSATAQNAKQFDKDTTLRHLKSVQLPVGESTHVVPQLDLAQAHFGVHVEGSAPLWRDKAPWNNWGFAVVAEQRRLRVLLVGDDNQFLLGALRASGRAEVVEVAAAEYIGKTSEQLRQAHRPDVLVLHQVQAPPLSDMPALVLAIAPLQDATATTQVLNGPEVLVKAGDHPLMRGVSFQDTNFDVARRLRPQPGDVILAAATLPGGSLAAVMVASEAPVRRVDWGIDLMETDLVARYAMPILVANALSWLAGDAEPLVPPLELGRPWAVEKPNRGGDWQYLEPGLPPRPARQAAGQVLASSEVHGIHVWRDAKQAQIARPTTLGSVESPSAAAPLGQPVSLHRATTAAPDQSPLARWAYWLLAVVAAICLEWLLYLRRRTV